MRKWNQGNGRPPVAGLTGTVLGISGSSRSPSNRDTEDRPPARFRNLVAPVLACLAAAACGPLPEDAKSGPAAPPPGTRTAALTGAFHAIDCGLQNGRKCASMATLGNL